MKEDITIKFSDEFREYIKKTHNFTDKQIDSYIEDKEKDMSDNFIDIQDY